MRAVAAFLSILLLLPTLARAAVESRTVPVSFGKVDGQEVVAECVLYYDPAITTSRPGILVFPEWWGLNDYAKGRARQLAELGYVALAVDVYGGGKVTNDPDEAGKLATPFFKDRALLRDRASKVLATLLKLNEVDKKAIGAMGYCFGGTASLELARTGAPLTGVVSFHGDLSNPDPKNAEKIAAKVLVCHGALDPMVPAKVVQAFLDEMNAAKIDYVFVAYANAVHAFTNPNAQKYPTHPIDGVAYNAQADKRSWEAMKGFWKDVFGR